MRRNEMKMITSSLNKDSQSVSNFRNEKSDVGDVFSQDYPHNNGLTTARGSVIN